MISYEPLFETMRRKGITSYRLAKMGFPMSNYYALKRGNTVTTQTLDTLCTILDCDLDDVMRFEKNPAPADAE